MLFAAHVGENNVWLFDTVGLFELNKDCKEHLLDIPLSV
jgi:hypothetical protein